MDRRFALSGLLPMQAATIGRIDVRKALRQRLDDLGVIDGTRVLCLRVCPLGDPTLYLMRGTVLALRRADAAQIEVLVSMENEGGRER